MHTQKNRDHSVPQPETATLQRAGADTGIHPVCAQGAPAQSMLPVLHVYSHCSDNVQIPHQQDGYGRSRQVHRVAPDMPLRCGKGVPIKRVATAPLLPFAAVPAIHFHSVHTANTQEVRTFLPQTHVHDLPQVLPVPVRKDVKHQVQVPLSALSIAHTCQRAAVPLKLPEGRGDSQLPDVPEVQISAVHPVCVPIRSIGPAQSAAARLLLTAAMLSLRHLADIKPQGRHLPDCLRPDGH